MSCSNAATRRAGLHGSLEWDARKLRASHRHGGTDRIGQSETSLITMSMRFSRYMDAAQTASHIPVQKQHISAPTITLRSKNFSARSVRCGCSCVQHFHLRSHAWQFSPCFRRPDRTPESDDAGNRSRLAKQRRGVLACSAFKISSNGCGGFCKASFSMPSPRFSEKYAFARRTRTRCASSSSLKRSS